MGFFDQAANVVTNVGTGGLVGYNDGKFGTGVVSGTILGGPNSIGGSKGGLFGGTMNDVVAPIVSGIAQGLSPAISSLGTALVNGFSGAFKDQNDQWKQAALAQIPNIQQASYPGFKSYLDGNYQLPQQFQVQPNNQSYDALKGMATQQGPSSWTQMATQDVQNRLPGQLNDANRFTSGALANAKNYMMSEGGLSSALEGRLNKQTNLTAALSNQNVRQNAQNQVNDLNLGDAQSKQTALNALPGSAQSMLAPQQFNISQNLGELNQANQADLERYKTAMQSWGAANIAGATAKSGKK